MFFIALATDYDGTIAHNGIVEPKVYKALEQFKSTGRRLILVTGRELSELRRVFPDLKLFDSIVFENGAALYDPASEEETTLAPPPPDVFVAELKRRKIEPLSIGRAIVATWEPNEGAVLEIIRDLGLELQIIFNKGAVMVLPPGVNKATGLTAALKEFELSPHNVVAIGDAENDHAFLSACGCGVAVANALPMLKKSADLVMKGARGEGVIELVELIRAQDAGILAPSRHGVALGTDRDGHPVYLEPQMGGTLIAGSSGVGKSTIAIALTERMREKRYQFCIFDPEGDYLTLEDAVVAGDSKTPPSVGEVLDLVRQVRANVVVATLALPVAERPMFFADLFPEISQLRARLARPHWLIVDEAHHVLPAEREDVGNVFPSGLPAAIFVTVHPEALSRFALRTVSTVIAVGPAAFEAIGEFCSVMQLKRPTYVGPPEEDEVLVWRPEWDRPRAVKVTKPRQDHKRHTRKYAEGKLGPDRSFYFRGPANKLNLRAHNLMLFIQLADGVDDETWLHHLHHGDYSAWFRDAIKDADLAREAEEIENNTKLDAHESRKQMKEAVSRRYTTPARHHNG